MKRTLILASVLVSVAALQSLAGLTSQGAARGDANNRIIESHARQPQGTCQWQTIMHPDWTRFPVNMDTHAAYAMFIYRNDGSVALKLEGSFPYSAFLSFTSYNVKGLLFDALLDKDITPAPNSVNPFQDTAVVNAANRSYQVFVLPNGQTAPANVNSLNMPPLSHNSRTPALAVLVMRIYLPEPDHNRLGGVDPPVITAVSAGDLQTPVSCPASSPTSKASGAGQAGMPAFGSFDKNAFPQPPSPQDGKIYFYRPPVYAIPFADGSSQYTVCDCTGYLAATLSAEQVAVVHLKKIPTFFDNTNTNPNTTMPDVQVRYISMGSYGATVIPPPKSGLRGNIAGPEMLHTEDGGVTFVVIPALLQKQTKEAIERLAAVKHFNVLPMAGVRHLAKPFLIYRNKVTATGFTEGSIGNVPCYLEKPFEEAPINYAASISNMGAYAPEGVTCKVSEFLNGTCGK
jgi:hypothetical protein